MAIEGNGSTRGDAFKALHEEWCQPAEDLQREPDPPCRARQRAKNYLILAIILLGVTAFCALTLLERAMP